MNTTKKIISILMCLLMLVSMMSVAASAAIIPTVNITSMAFAALIPGSSPLGKTAFTISPATLTIEKVGWVDSEGNTVQSTDTFVEGITYKVNILVSAASDITATFNAVINGETADVELLSTAPLKGKAIISREFTVENTEISSVEIFGVTVPVVGETPDYDFQIDSDAPYEVKVDAGGKSVEWYRNAIDSSPISSTHSFGEYDKYIFVTSLTPEEGYAFAGVSDIDVTVNGNTAEVISAGDDIIVMYDFGRPAENITDTDEVYTADIGNKAVIYAFTPSESGKYVIVSDNSNDPQAIDPYVTVYDQDYNYLTGDDDSGNDRNFYCVIDAEAGERYYIALDVYTGNLYYDFVIKGYSEISHQPTAEESYVELTWDPDADYQWYFASAPEFTEITDENATGHDFGSESVAAYEEGLGWRGIEYTGTDSLCYFDVELEAGQVLILQPGNDAAKISVEPVIYGDGNDEYWNDVADGEAVTFVAEQHTDYFVYAECAEDTYLKAYIDDSAYTALADETDYEISPADSGAYYCDIALEDGRVLRSNSFVAHVHTEEIIPAVAATCTETGLTEGKKCSVCDEVIVAQTTVDALGHTEEIIPAVAATCTETGLTEGKKCSVCDEVIVAQTTVDALGHTEEIIPAVAASCSSTGLTEGKKCSDCDEIITAQTVTNKLAHTYTDGICTLCGIKEPAPSAPAESTKPSETIKPSETTKPLGTTTPVKPVSPSTQQNQPAAPVKVKKPAKVKIKSAKSTKKKTVTVVWAESKNINGYEVSCSVSKKFKKNTVKIKLIKKAKTTKTTIKKLKSGKKYFIRVRAYKDVQGKKLFGAYSKVKTVKVK